MRKLLLVAATIASTHTYADDFSAAMYATAIEANQSLCDMHQRRLASFYAGERVSAPLSTLLANVRLCEIARAKLADGDSDGFLAVLAPIVRDMN